MKDKPRFYCGLHQRYHFAIVKPCYFGIEPKRQIICEKCQLPFSEMNPKCPEDHKVDVSRCNIT